MRNKIYRIEKAINRIEPRITAKPTYILTGNETEADQAVLTEKYRLVEFYTI